MSTRAPRGSCAATEAGANGSSTLKGILMRSDGARSSDDAREGELVEAESGFSFDRAGKMSIRREGGRWGEGATRSRQGDETGATAMTLFGIAVFLSARRWRVGTCKGGWQMLGERGECTLRVETVARGRKGEERVEKAILPGGLQQLRRAPVSRFQLSNNAFDLQPGGLLELQST